MTAENLHGPQKLKRRRSSPLRGDRKRLFAGRTRASLQCNQSGFLEQFSSTFRCYFLTKPQTAVFYLYLLLQRGDTKHASYNARRRSKCIVPHTVGRGAKRWTWDPHQCSRVHVQTLSLEARAENTPCR